VGTYRLPARRLAPAALIVLAVVGCGSSSPDFSRDEQLVQAAARAGGSEPTDVICMQSIHHGFHAECTVAFPGNRCESWVTREPRDGKLTAARVRETCVSTDLGTPTG
jgi:hypothetical protein